MCGVSRLFFEQTKSNSIILMVHGGRKNDTLSYQKINLYANPAIALDNIDERIVKLAGFGLYN
jgi:hypothetical protein